MATHPDEQIREAVRIVLASGDIEHLTPRVVRAGVCKALGLPLARMDSPDLKGRIQTILRELMEQDSRFGIGFGGKTTRATTDAAEGASERGKPDGDDANAIALSQAQAGLTSSSSSVSTTALLSPITTAIPDSAFVSLPLFVQFPSISELQLNEPALQALLTHVQCSAEEIAQLHPTCVNFVIGLTPPPLPDWEAVSQSPSYVAALAALPRKELQWLLSQLAVTLQTLARLSRQEQEHLLSSRLCVARAAVQLQREEHAVRRRTDADSLTAHEQTLLFEQVEAMLRARRIDATQEELFTVTPLPGDDQSEAREDSCATQEEKEKQHDEQASSSSVSSSSALPFDGAMDDSGWMSLQSLADHCLVRPRGVSVPHVRNVVLASPWLRLSEDGTSARAKRLDELDGNQLGMLSDEEALIAARIVGALASRSRVETGASGAAPFNLSPAVRLGSLLTRELKQYANRSEEVLSAAHWSPSISLFPASLQAGNVRWINLDYERQTRCSHQFTLLADVGRPKSIGSAASTAVASASGQACVAAAALAPAAASTPAPPVVPDVAAVVRSARYGFDPFWKDCTELVQEAVEEAHSGRSVTQLCPADLGLTNFPVKAGALVQPIKTLHVQFDGWSDSCTEHQFIDISPQRLNNEKKSRALTAPISWGANAAAEETEGKVSEHGAFHTAASHTRMLIAFDCMLCVS